MICVAKSELFEKGDSVMMKYQAHRGVGTEAPENTLPAFEIAARQYYDYIELDPCFTKDGYIVVLHDDTINRTCRYSDGREIEIPLWVKELTYQEVLKYDFGIAKSVKFKGTKIPLLSQVFDFAQQAGIEVKLDNRIQHFNDEQTEELYRVVEATNAKVAFTSSDIEYIKKIVKRFPNHPIHYDGYVNEEMLKALKRVMISNPLTVWLCMQSPLTSWVNMPAASEELCNTVKKYADLGLWLLDSEEQLIQADRWGACIIETTGSLKPKNSRKTLIDCHSHTKYSHDSYCEPTDSLNSAKEKGLAGFAITDHCDIEFCESTDVKTPIVQSNKIARSLGECVLSGVEMGEAIWHNDVANDIIDSVDLDIVLGSVHAVRYGEYTMPFSTIDFSTFSKNQIFEYMNAYFYDMFEMIEKCDFDVLSHLTNPLKYITGKYGIKVDLKEYSEIIERILKHIISKGIALEVNTSCIGTSYNEFMPEKQIIAHFRELGGYLVTLGSDAHTADRITHGFDDAIALLEEIGFKNLYYFKNRVPVCCRLEKLQ